MELSKRVFAGPGRQAAQPGHFEWIEQGAALVMRMGGAGTPTATWIIGRDDSGPDYRSCTPTTAGYRGSTDELQRRTWRMWRDTPEFSQRFDAEVSSDQGDHRLLAEVRRRRKTWDHDFTVHYSRLAPP